MPATDLVNACLDELDRNGDFRTVTQVAADRGSALLGTPGVASELTWISHRDRVPRSCVGASRSTRFPALWAGREMIRHQRRSGCRADGQSGLARRLRFMRPIAIKPTTANRLRKIMMIKPTADT